MSAYLGILIFFLLSISIAFIALFLSRVLAPRIPEKHKDSPYECGFPEFGDARFPVDIRYYLLAIIFVVFDIEMAFLVPWSLVYITFGWLAFFAALIFLLEFVVLLAFLWKRGSLDWD